jgi:hypothetical protein
MQRKTGSAPFMIKTRELKLKSYMGQNNNFEN